MRILLMKTAILAVAILFSCFFSAFADVAPTSAPVEASQTPPIASKEFLGNYLEVSEAILQSIANLEKGRDNTLNGKDLKPDDSFRRVKGRLDGLSTKYRFESPTIVTDFEKAAWKGLANVLGKLVETADSVIQSQSTFLDNKTIFESDLTDTINLFVKVTGFVVDRLPAEDKEKVRTLVTRYPLAQRGEPYLGALLDEKNDGIYNVITVYPKSVGQQAGMLAGDVIQSGESCCGEKLEQYVYSSIPINFKRDGENRSLTITPILYGFSHKPLRIGITTFENDTKTPTASQFVQDLTSAYFYQSDSSLSRNANALTFDSSPNTIAQYASSHALDYIIFGKITKFDSGFYSTGFWFGQFSSSGHVIHIEGDFRIFDRSGKLLGSTKAKSENTSVVQADPAAWLTAGAKFMNEALGPWLHRQINF